MIFNDKYDKIWFQEGNEALTYYDPLNKSNHRFPFPKQNAIGNFESRMPVNRVCFPHPGGEILLFDREKLEMTRINQLKPFPTTFPISSSFICCWIKTVFFGWHLQAAEYTKSTFQRSNFNC